MGNFYNKIAVLTLGIISSIFIFLNVGNPIALDSNIFVKKEIVQGSTFSVLLSGAGIATATANAILESSKPIYDLASISAGKNLTLVYGKEGGVDRAGLPNRKRADRDACRHLHDGQQRIDAT